MPRRLLTSVKPGRSASTPGLQLWTAPLPEGRPLESGGESAAEGCATQRLADDDRSHPTHCIALRNGNPVMPRGRHPKVSTRSATPNARLATASAARPISQRLSSDIGGLSTGAPAYNAGTKRSRGCSPCKLNMPPGATPCRTVSATRPPLRPLQAIVALDLDELATIVPPRGYGRD